MNDTATEVYANVWDALADTPQEAANLQIRSELLHQISAFIQRNGWTPVEAAHRCGVTQPHLDDLLRGRISRFSLDALINIAAALGCQVRMVLAADDVQALPPQAGAAVVRLVSAGSQGILSGGNL